MADKVLVTGGAGYIGSHACKALAAAGYIPVTFDNLCTGWREAVKFGPFEQGDLMDRARLDEVFAAHRPIAVMHFAALSQVGEAMREPGKYWRGNVCASLNLIEAAVDAGCMDFVFSSTCATYGDHDGVVLDETTPQAPLNSYGASKRAIEDMLKDFGAAHGLRSVIFRYFNVAGADPDAQVGEFHQPETHQSGGTHGGKGGEVIDQARLATNHAVPMTEGPRREGDAVSLVSGSARAGEVLGWRADRSTLPQMIGDAWRWHQTGGYGK